MTMVYLQVANVQAILIIHSGLPSTVLFSCWHRHESNNLSKSETEVISPVERERLSSAAQGNSVKFYTLTRKVDKCLWNKYMELELPQI